MRWGAATGGQLGTTVSSDNEQGGFDATTHLLQQGRRNIAFVGTAEPGYPEFLERWRGYCRALRAAGIEPDQRLLADADPSEASGIAAIQALLEREVEFDATVRGKRRCRDRRDARAGECRTSQFRPTSRWWVSTIFRRRACRLRALTTVTQDARRAGEALIDTLIEAVETGETSNSLLPVHLTIRDSSVCA